MPENRIMAAVQVYLGMYLTPGVGAVHVPGVVGFNSALDQGGDAGRTVTGSRARPGRLAIQWPSADGDNVRPTSWIRDEPSDKVHRDIAS